MNLSSIISSELRRKLLAHYFTHPDEKYYVREVAVLLNLDPGNLSKEFKRLETEGLFLSEMKGKIKFYRLNVGCPLYDELKQIVFKTEGVEGSLRNMVNTFSDIQTAFIYVSYAQGREKTSSDIDLVVVGTCERKRLTSKVRELEGRLNREINFNLYEQGEFDKKRREKGNFLNQVVAAKKIVLKGKIDE